MSNPFATPSLGSGSFLPEDYVAQKAETRGNIIILALFALVLAGVVGAFMVTNRSWQALKTRQTEVKTAYEAESKKMDQLKALENQRQEILEKAEVTAALAERVPRWALLAELTLRMPLDVQRDQLSFKSRRLEAPPPAIANTAGVRSLVGANQPKKDEAPKPQPPRFECQLTLAGTAERNNDVADYIAALRQSPVLEDVELQYIREAKSDDRLVRRFELVAKVRQDVNSKTLSDSLSKLVAQREEALSQGNSETPSQADADANTNAPNGQER